MFKNKKKKAFTLTELLIVVIIIGVLAAVVLPKFNKVMETRKTTEAEEMMAAVRSEQEYRCAMDKPYAGNVDKLASLESQNRVSGLWVMTKNYTYELESTGMLARSASKEYNLKMPSYADGRICCEGADCSSLNKDYPLCSELTRRSDFQVATECTTVVATPVTPPTNKECSGTATERMSCEAGKCGWKTRTATCNHTTGEWEYTAWNTSGCTSQPADDTSNCQCGHRTRTAHCNTGTGSWDWGDWDKTCTGPQTETEDCDDGYAGTLTRTQVCDAQSGEWTYNGVEWSGECKKTCATIAMEECGISNWSKETAETNIPHTIYTQAWGTHRMECTKKNQEALAGAPAEWQGARRYFWDFRENASGECKVFCRLRDGIYAYSNEDDYQCNLKVIGIQDGGPHKKCYVPFPREYEWAYAVTVHPREYLDKSCGIQTNCYMSECYLNLACPTGYTEYHTTAAHYGMDGVSSGDRPCFDDNKFFPKP